MRITQVVGGVHLHVRTCARADVPPFPYVGNGWTDCAEIWYVVKNTLPYRFTEINGGVKVHVRTCAPPLPYLGNGWTDCAEIWCVTMGPLSLRFTQDRG